MIYSRFVPDKLLHKWIECYWTVKGSDTEIQKVIPDGFSELIFHFGNTYNLIDNNTVVSQSRTIVAGQITQPIFLQPQGISDVVGIKFKPTGLWQLTGLSMSEFVNRTIDFALVDLSLSERIHTRLTGARNSDDRFTAVNEILLDTFAKAPVKKQSVDHLVERIQQSKGAITISELSSSSSMSTRKIERLFLEQVGLSAKQYARLVRFTHVFQLIQQPDLTKADISFLAGYFDQSHFNKEFREFTGENPEKYFDQNHAFANFFMTR